MGMGSGGPGRRKKGGGKRPAPGSGIGGMGSGAGPGSAAGRGSSAPRSGGFGGSTRRSGGGAAAGTVHADLDKLGPVPDRPAVYPPGSRYYLVPITFEVELLDRAAQEQIDATASAGSDGEGSGS